MKPLFCALLALATLVALPACDSGDSDDDEMGGTLLTQPTETELEAAGFTARLSCEVFLISASGSASGTISDADSACGIVSGEATYADVHYFKVTSTTTVRATMTSSTFAPVMFLNSPSAELAAAEPDNAQDMTATFSVRLTPGVYQILAGASDEGRGAYTLEIGGQ